MYVRMYMHLYAYVHESVTKAERSGRSGKTKWGQARASKPVCLLTRRKALQQSISDYKQGAPAYVRMRRKDRRKNRARGEEQTGEGRDKAVKVKKEDSGISVLASLHMKTHTWTYSAARHVQTQCGRGPACCSSSGGVWTGAGTLWSTPWCPHRWPAWCLGGAGRVAAACSPSLGCCRR